MGTTTKTIGGGSATGLADDFVSFLRNGLNTGHFGTGGGPRGGSAMGDTLGIAGVLNDLLAGGSGVAGGALSDMIHSNTEHNAAALRARFGAQGGTAFGTGAQLAEAQLRATENPAIINAISQQQLSALSQIFGPMLNLSMRGLPQAETITQPSALSQVAQGIGAVAPIIAAPFTGGMSMLPSLSGPSMVPIPGAGPGNLGPASVPNIGSISIP